MNQNEIITAVVALMVCGVLAGTAVIPLIAGISQETINEEYNDESNAGWLRMAYDNKPFDVEITADGDNITAGGQTGLNDDMILYADASACVMCVNGAFAIVNGYADTPEVINATSVAITNADGSLTVEADGDTVITATSPAWAYYPDATGKYAYFGADVDGVKIKEDINQAYAGNFAGVYTYNNIVVAPNGYGDLGGMELNATVTDGVIDSIKWIRESKNLEITSTLPVNTSYWESTTYAGSPSVKYIGPASDLIVVPTQFNGSRINHMTSLTSDNIASDGATVVWGLVGQPNAKDLNVNGTAVFGRGITFPSLAFNNTSVDSLVFSSTFNYSGSGANIFAGANVKEVLNLGSTDITPSMKSLIGLTNATIKDHIDANGYIAPLSTSAVVTKEGAVYDLIDLLPLIMVLGVVMMGVYVVGTRYA